MEQLPTGGCEPKRVTEVEQEFNRIDSAITELDARLDQLGNKIKPALRSLSSACTNDPKDGQGSLCELAEKIRGNRESVEIFVGRVNDILDRLEI